MQEVDTIREFLQLPVEALPSASWRDDGDDMGMGSAWQFLRDAAAPANRQHLAHLGLQILLLADRDGWRDGVTVTV